MNSVVELEHMPPPVAPVGSVKLPRMTPPGPNPRAEVTGPIALHHSKRWPGRSTVPSMIWAGRQMFAPKKLRSLIGNQVVQVPSFVISGAAAAACSVVSFGTTFRLATLTGAGGLPSDRAWSSAAIRSTVASTSSARPSLPATTPIRLPLRFLRKVADCGFRSTALAGRVSCDAICVVSITGMIVPSSRSSRWTQPRIVVPRMVHFFVPQTTMTSWASRWMRAFAMSTAASSRAGGTAATSTGTTISAGASMVDTAACAAATTGDGSAVRPWAESVVTGPALVIAIVASTGATSSVRTAVVIVAARASSSSASRGSIVVPVRARRTCPTARSATLPPRPARIAASTSASTSARRPKAAYGTAMSPSGVRSTIRPWSYGNAAAMAAVAAARSSPDTSTSPTWTPGRTRPS